MTHDEASPQVPDFVRGDLPPERRDAVGAHLGDCADCRELARVYEMLAGSLAALDRVEDGEHPTSAALVQLVRDPAGRPDLAEHVHACPQCAEDVTRVRAVLLPEGRVVPFRGGLLARAWRSPNARAAAAAVFVLALLAYPSYLGLRQPPGPSGPRIPETPEWSGAADFIVLGDAPRSAGEAPTVRVAPGQTLVPLVLEPGIDPAAHPGALRVEITDARGVAVWSTELAPGELARRVEAGGIVLLQVPARALAAGRYRLRLVDLADGAALIDTAFGVAR